MAQPSAPTGADHIVCPSCGRANSAGFRFCGNCGAALERTCPSCGSVNPASSRFCGNCGSALEAPAPAEATPLEERKVVTVLFADLTASTELAARMDPEDLRGVLQPFFSSMAAEVERFGGTVEKFIGDAVVAVFGAPTAHEDDPERAVRAAIGMHRRLGNLNSTGGVTLAMRIGVTTGEVVAAVRSEREGIVTGEAVNVAARLQAAAPPGSVLVGERTYRDTRHLFKYRTVGEVAVKGLDRPLPAWELLGETPAAESPGLRSGLVGRGSELDLLRILLDRSRQEGAPNLVTVVGPAGIGKTRLLQEFVDQVRGDDPEIRVVRGRCLPYGEGLTYWPLAEILKADVGILDSDPPEAILGKVAAAIRARVGESGEAAEVTGILLSSIGVEVEADPVAGSAPEVARRLIARAWRLYVESLASGGPAVAVIEDLHWADPGLLDVIAHVAERAAAPVLLLCTARPELSERRPAWGGGVRNSTTLALPPLSDQESGDLVRGLLGEGEVDEAALRAVLDRAEGTPFFAEELVRMLLEGGVLVRRGRTWTCQGGIPETLPDTVQGVIAARIDRLAPEEKRAIQDAAVVGRTFWQGAVERLGSRGEVLDELVTKGLLVEHEGSSMGGDRELAFNHVLTRDVVHQSIPRRRRAEAHALAGAWVEEVTRGRWEEFAEILAHHFEEADDDERTARYALLAGHRKRRVFAAEEAIRWYDHASEAAGRLPEGGPLVAEIAIGRGQALEQLARFPEAEADYQRALVAGRRLGDAALQARALVAVAHILWLEDRYEEGRTLLPEALATARAVGAEDLVARLLYTGGTMAFGRGEWREALRYHEEALEVARANGDAEGEALALHGVTESRWGFGGFSVGLEAGLRSSELLKGLGQRPMLYHNEYMVAWILWLLGRYDEARARTDVAVKGAGEMGDRRNEAAAHVPRNILLLSAGDLGAAVAAAEAGVRMTVEIGLPRMELTCRSFGLDALVEQDARGRLAEWSRACRELADRLGGTYLRPSLSAFEAILALREGRRESASSSFRRAREEWGECQLERLRCLRLEVVGWHEAGDADRLAEAALSLMQAAEEAPPFAAWGTYGVAAAAGLRGDWGETREAAIAALGDARRIGERPVEWRAGAVLADALDGSGDRREAAEARSAAAGVLRRIAGSIPDETDRACFLARPLAAGLVGSP